LTSAGSRRTFQYSKPRTANARSAWAIGSAPDQGAPDGDRLAAAVAGEDGVGRQHLHQPVHVAVARRLQEALGQLEALLGIGIEARALVVDVAARPRQDLTRVVLALADDLRDLGERVVKGVAQHEHGALLGGEALEQDEEGQRDGLLVLDLRRAGVLDERLGQPVADIALAPHPRRAQDVDGQPRRGRRQPRLGVVHVVGVMQAQQRLLDDVLGLGHRSEHPVGHGEGQRTELVDGNHCHRVARCAVEGVCTSFSPERPARSAAPSSHKRSSTVTP
jgi:hypothetical protein